MFTKFRVLFLTAVLGTFLFLHFAYGKRALPMILQRLPISSKWLGPPKGVTYGRYHKESDAYIKDLEAHSSLFPEFPLLASEKEVHFPETYVLKLQEGRVFGNNGVVITKEDKLLADTAVEWISEIGKHSIFCKNKLPKLSYIDEKVAVVASKSGSCYFHWMFDILPRLEILRRTGVEFDKIYLNPLALPFQKETIALLGIEEKNVITAGKKQHLQPTELIVPSMPSGVSGTVPKWVITFLREKFLPEKPLKRDRNIYISRKGTRKVLNEKELLEKIGFEEVVLENLSVLEQAKVFAEARSIVAPHGAGLTNLVFCEEGTKVIEIFSPSYINLCYFRIASQRGLTYHSLLGTPHGKSHDVQVDIEKVLDLIVDH
jgi:hypothetical protein